MQSQNHQLIDTISQNKENICPLQEGRNIAHFTGTAQKQSHKDELDNYMQEISFLRQSTLGDSNPQLKPLLETIINKFIFTRECRNDIRYLKCWCIYANICEDGLRVFSNLEERRIGQHYALFFECWARLLEQSGDYANARQVFEKGLKKKTIPEGRLRESYNSFIGRMNRFMKEQYSAPVVYQNTSHLTGPNKPLSILGMSEREPSKLQTPSFPMSYPHQSLPEQRPSGHPFQVFQDDQHPTHPSSTFISSAGYLPSEQMRTKENTETPLPWNLASISTLQTHSQPDQQTAFDDFSVFSDEPAEPQLLRTADPFSGPAESHQSQYQPLQSKLATFDNFLSASVPLVQQQMVNHADHAPETTTPPPQTHFENVDRNNTEDEVEGEEIFSVEEIRLKKHLQRMKEKEEALQRAAEAKLEEENRQIAEERMMVDTPAVPQQTEPNLRATTAGTDDDFDFTHANTIFGVFGSIYGAGEETPQPTRSTMTVTLPAILGVDETDNAGHDERADGWAADEDNQPLSDDVGRDTLTTAMLFGGEFGRLSHPRKRSRQTLRDSESPRHSGFGELDDDALCRSTKRMKLELTSPLRDPSKYSMNTLLMNDIIQPQSSFHTPPRQSRRSSFHNSTQTPPRGHSPPALSGVTSPFTFKARDEPLRRSDSSERSQKLVEREIVGERKSVNQEDILEGVSKDRQKREDLKDKTRKGMIEERCEPEHDKITTLQLFADLDDIGENSFLDREDTVIGGGTPGPSNRTNQFTPNRRWNDETAARLERTSEPRMDKENASWTDNGRSDAALPSTLNFLLDTHPTNLTSLDPFGYRPTISHLHQSPPSPHTSPPSHSFDTTIRNTVHTKAAINDVMLMFTNSRPAPVLSPAKRTPFQVRPNKVTFSATTPSTAGFLGAHATPVAPHTSSISTPFACTTPSTQNNSRQPLSVVAQRTTNADILTQSRMGQRNLVTPAKSPYLTAVDPLPNYSSFRQEPTALATPSHSATTQQAPPRMTMFGDIDGAETSWSVFKDI